MWWLYQIPCGPVVNHLLSPSIKILPLVQFPAAGAFSFKVCGILHIWDLSPLQLFVLQSRQYLRYKAFIFVEFDWAMAAAKKELCFNDAEKDTFNEKTTFATLIIHLHTYLLSAVSPMPIMLKAGAEGHDRSKSANTAKYAITWRVLLWSDVNKCWCFTASNLPRARAHTSPSVWGPALRMFRVTHPVWASVGLSLFSFSFTVCQILLGVVETRAELAGQLDNMEEHPKPKSTKPSLKPDVSPCISS